MMFHQACHPQNRNVRLIWTGAFEMPSFNGAIGENGIFFDLPLMFIHVSFLCGTFKMRAAQLETASSITVKNSNLALFPSIAPYDGQPEDQMNVDDQTQSKALTLYWLSILDPLT